MYFELRLNFFVLLRLNRCQPGGGWGALARQLGTDARTKNDEKWYFSKLGSAQRCHRLG